MTCCGSNLPNTSTTTPPVTGDCCLRVSYECQCIAGVDTWVLTNADCVDDDLCVGGPPVCDGSVFAEEIIDGCVCLDPLPVLPTPTCDPACCTTTTTTTPPPTTTTTTTPPPTTTTTTTPCTADCGQVAQQQPTPEAPSSYPYNDVDPGTSLDCTSSPSIVEYLSQWELLSFDSTCCYHVTYAASSDFGVAGACQGGIIAAYFVDTNVYFDPSVNACNGTPIANPGGYANDSGFYSPSAVLSGEFYVCGANIGPNALFGINFSTQDNGTCGCGIPGNEPTIINAAYTITIDAVPCGC